MEEPEDIRKEALQDSMVKILVEQLIKIMLVVCQSLTVGILANTYELMLVAGMKLPVILMYMIYMTVLVLVLKDLLLLLLLVVTITASQVSRDLHLVIHIILMTHYGMEQDALIIVVMTPPNLGSNIN